MGRKICHMTSVHTSKDVRVFYKECTSLASAGYLVYLVAPGEDRFENNVHVIGVGQMPRSRQKRMFTIARRVYKEATSLDCDVYHIHDPELIPYGLKLLKKGKRVIFDSHENIFAYLKDKNWIPFFIRNIVSAVSNIYYKRVLPRFSSLIGVTPHLYERLVRLNRNSCMITNYPIIDNKITAASRAEENCNFDLIFAGVVIPSWSHNEIIKAIQNVEGVKYIVYGEVQSEYLESLYRLDQENRFIYMDVIPHSEVTSQLTQASVGMALLKYGNNTDGKKGTLGNTKLFEYFLSGLPVICTDFDLWVEIISKYECGVCVDPNSVDEISNAVAYLLNNRNLARKMGLNARRAVEFEYNWESQEKILLEMYDNLFEYES